MSYFLVDIEADGPIPGEKDYSMVCFGAVKVDKNFEFNEVFYGKTAPISDKWIPESLAISGITREEHLTFPRPYYTLEEFKGWVKKVNVKGRPIFLADNNGFDYMFMHWYMIHFLGKNQDPFGWSSRNLGDVWHGLKKDMRARYKHLRRTSHDHNPVNDSKGNGEVLEIMVKKYGLKL